jgi:uncharacterized protein YecE (DUF72 family)
MADPSSGTALQDENLIRIGCAGLPSGVARASYWQRLDLLETDAAFFEPPRDVALKRWRTEAPPGAGFSLAAWQLITHDFGTPGYERMTTPLAPEARGRVGSFRATAEVKDAWTRTLAAARALGAEVVLFQTPPAFSPSTPNRDALRRFMGEVVGDTGELHLAWEPRGIWEPAQAAALADELGLIYAFDPLQLEVPPPESDRAYFRVHGLGLFRNKISEDHLDVLADAASGYARAWVVFANVEKYPDAQRFRKLLAGREFVDE